MYEELGYLDKSGYWRARFCDVESQQERCLPAHKLLARWMFRLPPPRGMHVHHRDGDRLNNHWSNLCFALLPEEHILLSGKKLRKIDMRSPYVHVWEKQNLPRAQWTAA